MKIVLRMMTTVYCLLFLGALASAGTFDNQGASNTGNAGFSADQTTSGFATGNSTALMPQGTDLTSSGMNYPGTMNLLPGMKAGEGLLPSGLNMQDKLKALGLGQQPGQEFKAPEQKIILQAQPGDGLITLSWAVVGARQKPDNTTPFRFVIQYGTESNTYTRQLNVGTVNSYTLRGLSNNQLYFIKVQGGNPDQQLLVSSAETQAMPLATEDLASPLERSFSQTTPTLLDTIKPTPVDRSLKQFGYDFFKNSLANQAASDNLPVGADYVLGPGDSVRIDVWGSLQARYDLTVDRNGEINIPKVGAVKVWGLSYTQAKDIINRAFATYYKGFQLNVTLGSLRTIQVFVVGEVEVPGTYYVSSLATVINALAAAGGPSKNGSLRTIKVSRNGKPAQVIDLYDMFLSGDRSRDLRLENGDTIFVPVIGPVAAVAGEVKRPAIYELHGNTSLSELLAMAGGITAAGDAGRIQLERIEGNSTRIVLDYEPKGKDLQKELAAVNVQDRDMVTVFPVYDAMRDVVTLAGNVVRPGSYQFRKGMRVSDLLPGYGALLPDSYLGAAEITRLALPDYHKEILSFNLGKALQGDERENLPLQEQDTIRVFARSEMTEQPTVSISGYVVSPGVYDYYPQMTVRDLITAAGSLKRNALLTRAELTRIVVDKNGAEAHHLEIDLEKTLAGDPANNPVLMPNDALIVRGVENWLDATDRFVTLKGEVRFPGVYSITKGERLSSVIARAGGFTDKAYLRGARFSRLSVQEEQQKRMDEVIARTEQDLQRKQAELASLSASKDELEANKAALAGLQKSLDKLKASKAQGRVVIHLTQLDEFRKSPYDLELMGGDTLEVPQTPSVVNVMGSVYNPTSFIHLPDKDVAYYLKRAGGATQDAEQDSMYVIKADGSVFSKQQSSFGIRWDDESRHWTFGGFMATRLDPGDTLVVPQQLEQTAWLRNFKDVTTILSQIALTAGVVIAAGL
ncbi:SLBB domain-containing protein [Geotalea uraniireducens]|nr:SLBB domain-containing protein [Geotalea uraniireducens]